MILKMYTVITKTTTNKRSKMKLLKPYLTQKKAIKEKKME